MSSPLASAPEPAVSFVVITPDGRLLERTVDNTVSVAEWDSPYQDSLWAAVHREVDPHRGQVGGVGLAEGDAGHAVGLTGVVHLGDKPADADEPVRLAESGQRDRREWTWLKSGRDVLVHAATGRTVDLDGALHLSQDGLVLTRNGETITCLSLPRRLAET